MIRRRSVVTGICSLVAAPSAVTMLISAPAVANSHLGVEQPSLDPSADFGRAPVVFKIQGWDQIDAQATDGAGQQVVAIHLTNSWRSSWL